MKQRKSPQILMLQNAFKAGIPITGNSTVVENAWLAYKAQQTNLTIDNVTNVKLAFLYGTKKNYIDYETLLKTVDKL